MDIRSVGIVGTGVMGTGIARAAAQAGYQVTVLKWTHHSPASEAREAFEAALAKEADRGKIGAEEAAGIRERLNWADKAAELSDCDLVIESIVEDASRK